MPTLDFTEDISDDFTCGRPTGDATMANVKLDTDESKLE